MNISIYPGSSSFSLFSASYYGGTSSIPPTAFGFYDSDAAFKVDADRVTTFAARRLGYPMQNVELQDINFWMAFEEAVTTYGNELYSYLVRDNMLTLTGAPTSTTINNTIITPNLGEVIRLSQQYASEAGVGGNITYRKGSINLTASIQDYNLEAWASSSLNGVTGSIEIKRIYYQSPPVLAGLSPLSADSASMGVIVDSSFSNFLLTPLNLDLGIRQQIEMNQQVRLSNYTFELINNRLRIFPIPDGTVDKLWFDYIQVNDRANNSIVQASGSVTNPSNVPYTNPTYTQINSIGRQWIFEYTLALCKEMLGLVRGKYVNIPIPDSEITLNQGDLLSMASKEKEDLITRLRLYFDETSKQKLLERKAIESGFRNSELGNIPMTIYIG